MSFIVKMRFIVWDGKFLIYLIISMRQLGMVDLLVCHLFFPDVRIIVEGQ
jgi:hypothetical protein